MENKRITIKELAELLNVSPSTVSRALKNHYSIGEGTCKKVQKLALKLGYFPNSVASNLRRQKTNLIGVIVPRIERHFHSHAISGIEEVANSLGYYVSIFQSNNSYKKEVDSVRMLLSNNADGVIASLAMGTKDVEHFHQLKKNDIPLVFYDRICREVESGRVIIDDYEAAYKACEHLISIGCKRIAHIAGNQDTGIYQNRLNGYKAALKNNNMAVDDSLIFFGDTLSLKECPQIADSLFKSPQMPDGLFCANDNAAICAIQAAKKLQINVPDDIAVTGFSNTPASTIISPSLTTVDDHAFEMGQAAARLLIRQIENNDQHVVAETITIRNDLIIRDSTAKKHS